MADPSASRGVAVPRLVKLLNSRQALIATLVLGCLGRIAWTFVTTAPGATGEAFNIARALAQGHGFADAYGAGHGPTAHMLPTSPLLAGTVYALFGVRSFTSETILATYAIVLSLSTLILFYLSFARLGVSQGARRMALFAGLLLPVYTGQEVVDYRIWEGGLAAFLLALYFYLLTSRVADASKTENIGSLAIVNALLFFVNPAFGIAAYLCAARSLLPVKSVAHLARQGFAFTVPLALLLAPWNVRNIETMGHFIPLRSNAGLELAIGVHAAAVDSPTPRETFQQRLKAIHPAVSAANLATMQRAGGEVAYSQSLSMATQAWMRQNVVATAVIAGRHVRQIIAPEPWQFRLGAGQFANLRSALASLVGVLGLIGLCVGVRNGGIMWQNLALLMLVPMALLCLFQPIPRYTYLFYPLFLFATTGLTLVGRRVHAT